MFYYWGNKHFLIWGGETESKRRTQRNTHTHTHVTHVVSGEKRRKETVGMRWKIDFGASEEWVIDDRYCLMQWKNIYKIKAPPHDAIPTFLSLLPAFVALRRALSAPQRSAAPHHSQSLCFSLSKPSFSLLTPLSNSPFFLSILWSSGCGCKVSCCSYLLRLFLWVSLWLVFACLVTCVFFIGLLYLLLVLCCAVLCCVCLCLCSCTWWMDGCYVT